MKPVPAPRVCGLCGDELVRLYFLGYRCVDHAPSEAQVREHAIARADRRETAQHLAQRLSDAESAIPTRKETR